jgi:hypothetical protein
MGDVCQVWTAPVPTTISSQTIQATQSAATTSGAFALAAISGVSSLGATGTGAGSAGNPAEVTITPQAAGSLLIAVGGYFDDDTTVAASMISGQTLLRQAQDTGNRNNSWLQHLTALTPNTNPVTLGVTRTTLNDVWTMAALEIKG